MLRNVLLLLSFLATTSTSADTVETIDLGRIDEELRGEGAVGWIHGAVNESSVFVFTYRDPDNFFNFINFPLVAITREAAAVVSTLHRHDKVKIKGRLLDNEAPIKHVGATEIVVVEPYDGEHGNYQRDIPDDILNGNEMVALVHATAEGGRVLVLEVRDGIYPVVVENPAVARDLYRNDKVHVRYAVRSFPGRPSHLEIPATIENPVTVLDRMVDWHGDSILVEGALVMFPRSPQILFDVYALEFPDETGANRYFTLVNFEDSDTFAEIREKLGNYWQQYEAYAMPGRNKWINHRIRLRVNGTVNVIEPGQANPQILVEDADDIVVTIIDP